MAGALRHRGPDGEGFHVDEAQGVVLAHRRLAVIDLEGGAQPMSDAEGDVTVVFNGEIFNFVELRRELEAAGHVFRTDHSDTEVLVHGYKAWGEALPLRLNGMFAFAIHDRVRRTLFLARDRMGKKPLYYHAAPGFFAFASELTALLRHPEVPRRTDAMAVRKLLAYGFIPSPRSILQDVKRLPGGHAMTVPLDRPGSATSVPYWEFRIEAPEVASAAEIDRWTDELRHLLGQAVRRRLVSDVPLGIFLSGGIDSTAVLAFASEGRPAGAVKTFCIGFREPSFDESAHARAAAQHFRAAHHEEVLAIDAAEALIPEVLARMDEPLGDPSIVPTALLCRFARRHVTVALGGDGGDELFAGYDPFKALGPAAWYQRLVPAGMRGGVRRLADLLPVSQANMSLEFRIKRGLRGAAYPPALWNPAWLGALDATELAQLLEEPVSPETLYDEALALWDATPATNIVDKTLEFYTRLYLQDDILVKADRASMMASLELRSPFLDPDLVEFARRLPHTCKFRDGETKWLLKRALRGLVPDAVLDRRKKGFGIPLAAWMRRWDDERFGPALRALPSKSGVRTMVDEHRDGRRDHRMALWCLLALGYGAEAHP